MNCLWGTLKLSFNIQLSPHNTCNKFSNSIASQIRRKKKKQSWRKITGRTRSDSDPHKHASSSCSDTLFQTLLHFRDLFVAWRATIFSLTSPVAAREQNKTWRQRETRESDPLVVTRVLCSSPRVRGLETWLCRFPFTGFFIIPWWYQTPRHWASAGVSEPPEHRLRAVLTHSTAGPPPTPRTRGGAGSAPRVHHESGDTRVPCSVLKTVLPGV